MAIIRPENMNFSNKNIIMIISGLPGVGKACADDTKVLTDMGFLPICEVKEGFKVYGEDGKLHTVVGVYPQGVRPSYKVSFNDGTSVICDEEHIWTVEAGSGNSKKKGFQPFTVKQLLEKGIAIDSPSRAATGRKPLLRWKIPVVQPIEHKHENYYIDPYVAGVLLGDGCLSGGKPIFSCPDTDLEIMQKVESRLMPGYSLTRHDAPCPSYYIKSPDNDNEYAQVIKAANLDVRSSEKEVPYQYLRGSIEQRTELLRGLMDTDGSAAKNRVSFSTTSKKLANGVVRLVQSLGGIAKINTYDRTDEQKSVEYDVNVRLNICPFSLKRKAKEWRPTIISRYIESIEKVDDVSCTCIMVDNPTSLFVIENHIVTHNTTLALSAPDVLLIDADEGMARVNPAHRKDSSICKTYEELLEDIKAAEGQYKTIAIDTGGALIELMKDWAMRTEPSANRKNGGFSLQGYGVIKSEFLRMSADLRRKFNVIFLFHTTREKNGDEDFFEIVVEGSTRSLVYQPADLAAYCHIVNGERYLGFTPTMNYNAKSAYGIKGLVKVPELKDGDTNDFLTKLFEQVKSNLAEESASLKPQQEAYEQAMQDGQALLGNIKVPEDAIPALNEVRKLEHALTSQKELEAAFKAKVKELGWVYDGKAKKYVEKGE